MSDSSPNAGFGRRSIEPLRGKLVALRRDLLADLDVADEDLRIIEETRESELGERSQEGAAADLLTLLGEHDLARLRQIEGALSRIARGSYGMCAGCAKRIALTRLRADPVATLCSGCANTAEQARESAGRCDVARGEAPEESQDEPQPTVLVPSELASLDDAELAAMVRESFREEVGRSLEQVRVLCRHGLVTLAGEVSSDELRQVARRIIEDEIGLEVVDRLSVTPFAAQPRARRVGGRRMVGLPVEADLTDADLVGGRSSENILDVEEEGLNFIPPTRPVAETE